MWVSFIDAYQKVRTQITSASLATVREDDQPSIAFIILLILLVSCTMVFCYPITRNIFEGFAALRAVAYSSRTPRLSSPASLDGVSNVQPSASVCPELRVPKDRECRLFVPRVLEVNAWAPIRSSQGEAILHTRLVSSSKHAGQRLSLMSPDQQKCYGFAGQREPGVLSIFPGSSGAMSEPDAQPVAELRRDRDGSFLLESSGGAQALCRCNVQKGTLEVMDGQRLMAMAVPDSSGSGGGSGRGSLEIRVGPGVDVGLVILVLLGTGLLLREGSRDMHVASTAARLVTPPRSPAGSVLLPSSTLAPATGSSVLAPSPQLL